MRLILLTFAIAFVAVSAASLKPEFTDNIQAFANARSREFAKGDNPRAAGWRECVEMENGPAEIGMVCEGTRAIEIPGGQIVDVNYFCEFRLSRVDQGWFRVEYQLCQ
jgi:hypothetical protein